VSCFDRFIELELMISLQRFADRIARHPTLQRAQLVKDFLESTEWVHYPFVSHES
jgi:sorting nexin-4